MRNFFPMAAGILCVHLLPVHVFAQSVPPAPPAAKVTFKPDEGLVVAADTLFKLNVRFRMQDRFGLLSESGDHLDPNASDIRVRRLRLRFYGYIFTKRLRYNLHLGFSRADLDLDANSIAQPVRDAIVFYDLKPRFTLGFGQQKLPGNRQQVVSSGSQQFIDRSIVTAAFTLDRDFGIFGTWTLPAGRSLFLLKGAITSGEGRNAAVGDEGLCYTGRIEWLPFGKFTADGDYFEGDLLREEHPKLSLAIGYSTDQGARRSGAQLGRTLYTPRTINTLIADALFKYKGWALSTEYIVRNTLEDPFTYSVDGLTSVYVLEGNGTLVQLSRMIGAKNEVALRYARVSPGSRLTSTELMKEESWLGYSYYLNQHRIKLQGNISYSWTDAHAAFDHTGNRWGLFVQVEFGI